MSSPTRQMSSRKLPPLPGSRSPFGTKSNTAHSSTTSPSTATIYSNDKRGIEKSNKDLSKSLNDGPFRPALVSTNCDKPTTKDSPKHFDAEDIRTFLHYNPMFLENYVMKHVDQARLERWLIRKTTQEKRKAIQPVKTTTNTGQGRPSLSKWKFCVHSDKKKMLEELTRDIHQSPNKEKIVSELAQCIASACHADSYSLYLLEDNDKEMFLYSPNIPGCRMSAKVLIEEGTTIAAYVAKTMTSTRTSEILADPRFPKGTGVEESTAQSVICQPIVDSSGNLVGVIELSRRVGREAFGDEDEEIVNSYLVWGGIALYYAEVLTKYWSWL